MNPNAIPHTRIVTFHARPGQGEALAELLGLAGTQAEQAPGCELWLVQRDLTDRDTVHVSELWSAREMADAALQSDGTRENVDRVRGLLDGAPVVREGEPVAGGRVPRGQRGASAFAILDAPDLSRDAELLGRYDLDQVVEARYVREQLGAVQSGLTHYRLPPGRRQGWAHRHGVTEEIYVALSGSGKIWVDQETLELRPLVAVRVAPATVRELEAGSDGLEVLVFGPHYPGDGELVSGGDAEAPA